MKTTVLAYYCKTSVYFFSPPGYVECPQQFVRVLNRSVTALLLLAHSFRERNHGNSGHDNELEVTGRHDYTTAGFTIAQKPRNSTENNNI